MLKDLPVLGTGENPFDLPPPTVDSFVVADPFIYWLSSWPVKLVLTKGGHHHREAPEAHVCNHLLSRRNQVTQLGFLHQDHLRALGWCRTVNPDDPVGHKFYQREVRTRYLKKLLRKRKVPF